MTTIVETLQEAHERVGQELEAAGDGAAKREFALAKTHIEDAIMRTNIGFARARGLYAVSDVEKLAPREV